MLACARRTVKYSDPSRRSPSPCAIDADVLVWFRRQGRGYQTRMNAVLRQHMRAIVGGIAPDS